MKLRLHKPHGATGRVPVAVAWVLFGVALLADLPQAHAASISNKVSVEFFTKDDDKDPEDTVEIWLERRGVRVSEIARVGKGQRWKDNTNQGPFEVKFLQVGFFNSKELTLGVQKTGTDQGWNMQLQVHGLDVAGQKVRVLPVTGKVRFNGRNQLGRWSFSE